MLILMHDYQYTLSFIVITIIINLIHVDILHVDISQMIETRK